MSGVQQDSAAPNPTIHVRHVFISQIMLILYFGNIQQDL